MTRNRRTTSLSSAYRDNWQAALTDGVLYGESLSLTLALDDLVKIAVLDLEGGQFGLQSFGVEVHRGCRGKWRTCPLALVCALVASALDIA